MRPGLERTAYAAALRGLGGAVQALERALGQCSATIDLADSGWTPRLHLLLDDLCELGESPALPIAPPPALGSIAEVAGVLYVLEGSRLGGHVLARSMANQPGGPYPHTFFLGGSPAHPSARWNAWLTWAERKVPHSGWDDAATAARNAFALFRRQLDHELGSIA